MAAHDTAGAASDRSALAMTFDGGGVSASALRPIGLGLAPGMNDAEVFERLNAWGVARDAELVDLRTSLASTQTIVDATFVEARGTLMTIVHELSPTHISEPTRPYYTPYALFCLTSKHEKSTT